MAEFRVDPSQLEQTAIHRKPYAFIDKRGTAILIRPLRENRHDQLVRMYLGFQTRDQFSGMPPIREVERVRWVEGMIRNGVNLIAFCFDAGVIGHGALFPIDERTCEMLIALDERRRNVGVGTQLTRELLQLAHELDFERIWLNVDRSNRIAQHVYAKNGFRWVARHGCDEIEMIADLTHFSRLADVPVEEVMTSPVICIPETATCREALSVIVCDRVGALPVVDGNGRVVGILSETDLLDAGSLDLLARDVSTKQVVCVRRDCRSSKIVRLFQSRKMRCIPVLDEEGRLVGIVGRRDILARYARDLSATEPGSA